MFISRHYPGFLLPSSLGCSAGFWGPLPFCIFLSQCLISLKFLLLWLRSWVLVSASLPAAFSEFSSVAFSFCSSFCSPRKYKSEWKLPLHIPVWASSCIVPGHTSDGSSQAPPLLALLAPLVQRSLLFLLQRGTASASTPKKVDAPLTATWPGCTLPLHTRIVHEESLVHKSLPLEQSLSALQLF